MLQPSFPLVSLIILISLILAVLVLLDKVYLGFVVRRR